eukprot:snap_masked-scaffold_8-processed-gene-13.40-mRNA-1 protein AED:1.00 eAED:1.00 QI:0/-1/0/0/-1/1/1/0/426
MTNEELQYDLIISKDTEKLIDEYRIKLQTPSNRPGRFLLQKTRAQEDETKRMYKNLNFAEFTDLLMQTKRPVFFTQASTMGAGEDWNDEEFKILGEINCAMDVQVFDNAAEQDDEANYPDYFKVHDKPFDATLIYTPGILLERPWQYHGETPDYEFVTKQTEGAEKEITVVEDVEINSTNYYTLFKKRILPCFLYINMKAEEMNKDALVVSPAIGGGSYAGLFIQEIPKRLQDSFEKLLKEDGDKFPRVKCLFFDPEIDYSKLQSEGKIVKEKNIVNDVDKVVNGIKFRIRNSKKVENQMKQQLSTRQELEEEEGEFSDMRLFKLVFWDAASYPGNDFFVLDRSEDCGTACGATDSMSKLLGAPGRYKIEEANEEEDQRDWRRYVPLQINQSWKQYVEMNKILMHMKDNLYVAENNGEIKKYELKK